MVVIESTPYVVQDSESDSRSSSSNHETIHEYGHMNVQDGVYLDGFGGNEERDVYQTHFSSDHGHNLEWIDDASEYLQHPYYVDNDDQ